MTFVRVHVRRLRKWKGAHWHAQRGEQVSVFFVATCCLCASMTTVVTVIHTCYNTHDTTHS